MRLSNPADNNHWFVFDSRTRSIRQDRIRNLALSGQLNQGYRIGRWAVMRNWMNQPNQKVDFFKRSKRNIVFAFGKKCLDVSGGANRDNAKIHWWNCHNGLNQAWYTDLRGMTPVRNPVRDGIRMQIKSRMGGNRALFYERNIGRGQFMLRIRNNTPRDNRQWFVFDSRTRSIRVQTNRGLAISTMMGQGWRIGRYAVVRPFRNEMF